jgi:hypothetical protein
MKAFPVLSGAVLFAALLPAQTMPAAAQTALANKYCAGCHNDKLKSGGMSLAKFDFAHPEQNADLSEKIIRKLIAGRMPPAGLPKPDTNELRSFVNSLAANVDRAAALHPWAGAPDLHRLNRTEYRNSVRDLLGMDVDVTTLLPPDDMSHGFDNMADSLSITPALMDGYVRAAGKISRSAIGDPTATPAMTSWRVPKVVNQMRHVEGTPWGTRGGIAVDHDFPADGEYTFKVTFYYDYLETLFGQSLPPNLQGQQIEISIDGGRIAVFTIDPNVPETKLLLQTPPITVTAGPHKIAAAFVAKFDGPIEDQFRQVDQSMVDISAGVPGLTALPHLHTLFMTGPVNPTGVSDTLTRNRILTCKPANAEEELPCARKILAALGRQAWRRPLTDGDMEALLTHYQRGKNKGNFDSGIRMALQAILASPDFVFRFERQPAGATPGTNFRLTDLELASRLSYFLWSSLPDQQLLATNQLRDPKTLEAQVHRMLTDSRSQSLSTTFAYQWLHLQNLKDIEPDIMLYGNFTRNLAQSMTRETEMLFDSIVREDRPITDLLTANYTFVDEALAKHYGMQPVVGSAFRRVQLADPNRFGLLGQGSILTLTSTAARTSPVQRGKYVMEVLLGSQAPVPPPNVPPLKENVRNEKPMTVRERMEEHRQNEPCHSCHQLMDPIGLSLENYDAIGQWRTKDAGLPVDANGVMYDGARLSNPVTLRDAIVRHNEAFINAFAENLLQFALGRVLETRDMPTVRGVVREAAKNDYRFSSFVQAIVKSTPFQMRRAEEAETTSAGGN